MIKYYDSKNKKWIVITNPKQKLLINVGDIIKVGKKAVRIGL